MKSIIRYSLLVLILAYSIRELLYIGIRKNKSGEYDKLNTLFIKANNYNTLIAGSSRAEAHFNPLIIDSITHLNTYNIGLEGAVMPIVYDGLEAYLENSQSPQNLILHIDFFYETGKSKNEELIFRFPRYFPYLSNQKLYQKFRNRDSRFFFFKYIPFYSMPYFNEQYLGYSLKGYFSFLGVPPHNYIKGYSPLPITNEDIDIMYYSDQCPLLEPVIYNSLDSIIAICKSRDIRLFFVFSPLYYKDYNSIQNKYQLLRNFKNIADSNHIKYFDYSLTPLSYNKKIFTDSRHLNINGSTQFSRLFAADLKQYLSKK